ncbi:MAG: cadherin repeat domain-containing protein, partial [Gammaproteobacteria bacterium]|nr:cadherin repeat domain-containing protein [Gammaproteobacteria bacterium]
TGTAEANSSVELFAGSTLIGKSTADNSGNWSHTIQSGSALAGGTHSITVKATDAAGNSSAASNALSLTIDTSEPAFSSTATAAAIDENSGANQVIYTATATDTSAISYSLKQGNSDNAASFSINSSTGKVSLTGNPDYETKSSYAFTVVASDAAGNSSDKAISLAINDLANRGAGSFAISGIPNAGNELTVHQNIDDPDGNGSISYKWQTTSDGSTWTTKGTKSI